MGSIPRSPEDSRQFVRALEIEPPPLRAPATRSAELEGMVPRFTDSTQAVVIGSQIAEFAADVPADLRPQISNSFLLAQLAANKAIDKSRGGTRKWFEKYVDVLTSIGWVGEGIVESKHKVTGDSLQAHQEIISVIALALGPAAAAASIVLAALKGLKDMSKDSPWITLFDRQSQTRSVQQFQIAYARAKEGAGPEIILACFELSASASVTQILFFKTGSSRAELDHRQATLSMNETIFKAVTDDVKVKLADHVSSLIRDMEN